MTSQVSYAFNPSGWISASSRLVWSLVRLRHQGYAETLSWHSSRLVGGLAYRTILQADTRTSCMCSWMLVSVPHICVQVYTEASRWLQVSSWIVLQVRRLLNKASCQSNLFPLTQKSSTSIVLTFYIFLSFHLGRFFYFRVYSNRVW